MDLKLQTSNSVFGLWLTASYQLKTVSLNISHGVHGAHGGVFSPFLLRCATTCLLSPAS